MFKECKEIFLDFYRKRLAWPSPLFFYSYATISGATTAFMVGSILLTSAQTPASFGEKAALAAVLALANIGAFALIYLLLAICYRMLLDLFESVRRFRTWLPGARQRTSARIKAGFAAVKSSGRAAKKRAASLRLPTAAELGFSLLVASAFAVIFAVGWFFWPAATRLSLSIPSWLPGSAKTSADIFEILIVDFFISCIPAAISLSIWTVLVKALVRQVKRFKK